MYTGIRLLLLIHPIISSFFFLFNFHTLKFFITLFSGTNRPRSLKLGTNVDSEPMYRYYRNQASAAFSSHYFFIFLPIQLSNIKKFHHIFLRTVRSRRLKLRTYVDSGQMYRVYRNQVAAYLSLYFFICLSLQFLNIKNFRHTVLTNCEA